MKNLRKNQNTTDNRKDFGSGCDYASPNNYWQSFYVQQKTH